MLTKSNTGQLNLFHSELFSQLDTIDANTPIDYSYDQNDNRLTKLRQDMSLEEYFEQQENSNRISVIEAVKTGITPIENLPNRDMVYNDVGRLFQLIEEGTLKAEYIYNDGGQRTRKTIYQADGITVDSITIYHYDQMGYLVTETDQQGNLIKDYIWNSKTSVAQIDKTGKTESIVYLYTDHLMTNRLATDESQNIVWRWEGEAFGNTLAKELAGVQVNLRFPGQYYDSETNLHYNIMRYYDPQLGQYITSDPIGLDGGMNTYSYVNQNPVNFYDPTGLCGWPCLILPVAGACFAMYCVIKGIEICEKKFPETDTVTADPNGAKKLQCVIKQIEVCLILSGVLLDPISSSASEVGKQVSCTEENNCK